MKILSKNNVKIKDIPEDKDEDEEKLINTDNTTLKSDADVIMKNEDILAIHRKVISDQF